MMEAFEAEVKSQKKKWKRGSSGEIESDGEEGEEDLIMTQTTGTPLDPITKRPMEDPVKNVYCGHSYERTSILALIAKSKKTKCPMGGCPNEAHIEANHLIDDTGLKKRIQNLKKK